MMFALICHAQPLPPKPFLQRNIEHGATELEGNYNPLDRGIAPVLQVWVADKEGAEYQPAAADFAVNLVSGVFTVTVKKALQEKQLVKVRLTTEASYSDSVPVTVLEKPKSKDLYLLSVDALSGATKLTVLFQPISRVVGKPAVCVRYDKYVFDTELTEDQLKAGKAEISMPGALIADNGSPEVTVTRTPCAQPVGSNPEPGSSAKAAPVAAALQLKLPLREGDSVITGTAHTTVQRVCVAVLGGATTPGDAPQFSLGLPLTRPRNCHEATRTLQLVHAAEWFSGDDSLKVLAEAVKHSQPPLQSPLPGSLDDVSGFLLMEMEVAVDDKHTFKFDLDRPLYAGSKVLVREVFPGAPGGAQVSLAGPAPVVVDSAGLDLGRVRAFFTVGATISQSNESFGKADPYVAFSIDGSLMNGLVKKKKRDSDIKHAFANASFGASLHWTVGARLTQTGTITAIGVATPSLESAQSSMFFGGLYLPVRVRGMDWVYQGTQYSAFVAPLAKFGVTALKDGVVRSRTTSSTTTAYDPCPLSDCSQFNKTDTTDPKLAYAKGPAPFYGLGFRAGVMKYDLLGIRLDSRKLDNRQIAPDPVMYVDVTWGQNQAYVTPGKIATSIQTDTNKLLGTVTTTTTKVQGFTVERRLAVEARFKIPYLPAEIGGDLNLNKEAPLTPLSGADGKVNFTDFRFFLGLRMDVAKVLSTVLGKK
jgi:hypothetical protein